MTMQPLGHGLKRSCRYCTRVSFDSSIPYIAGLREGIRKCVDFDIKTAFKLGKTLRSHLTESQR